MPLTIRNQVKRQHKDASKNLDYTPNADRVRTVSWSAYCHPTGVVKLVNGYSTFPLSLKLCNQKDKHFELVNNPPYRDRGETSKKKRRCHKYAAH